ncbi:hypothetical protein Turpa_3600 [Turneriella parva DSM 21527]|uniref:Uncharacterized protein n=1 Tax=Turneriella parva (strain ATCC BAA-1111 / DSM 21527 / NCTC 11395 / H) TaxID=869212 RepID=I4BAC7_TURPD|nr:hypothetical protein Turpa_3600 [Turneriella parva DSM 21527]
MSYQIIGKFPMFAISVQSNGIYLPATMIVRLVQTPLAPFDLIWDYTYEMICGSKDRREPMQYVRTVEWSLRKTLVG